MRIVPSRDFRQGLTCTSSTPTFNVNLTSHHRLGAALQAHLHGRRHPVPSHCITTITTITSTTRSNTHAK